VCVISVVEDSSRRIDSRHRIRFEHLSFSIKRMDPAMSDSAAEARKAQRLEASIAGRHNWRRMTS
jgi:hypothetical protein